MIRGVILGFLLGVLLGYSLLQGQGWKRREGRKRDIDRLIEQFQELFRKIDQKKHQRP